MKLLSIICILSLLLGILSMPIEYYTYLRFIVFIGAIGYVLSESQKGVNAWVITFIVIGILFNPIFPVYLKSKGLWSFIDLVTALIFGAMILINENNVKDEK
jgi:hypothetical protein